MNLNSVKLGFFSYLQKLEQKGTNLDKETTTAESYSDVSIFTHSQEFRNYLQDEYNVSADVLSLSINDLMNLKIENGKLVKPEDNETPSEESGDMTVPKDIQTPSAEGEVSEMSQDANTQAPAVQGEVSDTPQEANVKATVTDEESAETDSDTQTENDKENISLIDYMNMLFEDEDFLKEYDGNGDGTIDDEEFSAFKDSIKALDGNADDLSFEDLEKKADEIKENKAKKETADESTSQETDNTTASTALTGSDSTGTGSGGGGSSYSPGNYTNTSSPTPENKLEKMSVEELKGELDTAQTDLDEKQETLTNIANDTDPQIASMKEDADKALDEYNKALKDTNNEDAKELASVNTQIAEREQEIQENDAAITNQEATVSDCTQAYEIAEANLSQLESQKEALIAANNDSETKDSQKSKNTEKLQAIEEAIAQAETEKQNALEAKEEAEKTLDELNKKKEEIEKKEPSLEELEQQKTDLESNLSSLLSSEPLAGLKETYETAKSTYETEKQSALTQAQSDVTDAQEWVTKVNDALKAAQTKENKRNYSPVSDFQAAVDWARQYDDYSQAQIYPVFKELGYRFDDGLWCADFVAMALAEGVGEENLPEWYQNCSNKASCPSIQHAGEGHQINIDDAQPGDIVLYDWNGDGSADHVGLFVNGGDGVSNITAIEGNTWGAGGTSCVEETDKRNRNTILGVYSMRD